MRQRSVQGVAEGQSVRQKAGIGAGEGEGFLSVHNLDCSHPTFRWQRAKESLPISLPHTQSFHEAPMPPSSAPGGWVSLLEQPSWYLHATVKYEEGSNVRQILST